MKKRELLSLPEIILPNNMIEFVKNEKPELKRYCTRSVKVYKYTWFYKAKVFLLHDKNILKISLFDRHDIKQKNYKPRYEVFLSKEERQYLTYDTSEEKWRTAKIDSLKSSDKYCHYPIGRCYCDDTEKIILDYLDNDKAIPFESIFYFQSQIKDELRKIEHKRIADHIDSVMELVPELPTDFENWIRNIAMIHSRYIYYNYSRNVKTGYCTHCEHDVEINKPKHNMNGTCSCCKSEITYKAIKKAAVVYDEGYASIFQKTKEGIVLRYFEIRKKYEDFKKPKLDIYEAVRIIYDMNFMKTGTFEYAEFKRTGVIRWCVWEDRAYSYSYYRSNNRYVYHSTLYDKNLKKVFQGSEYQYSAIELFAKGLKGERFRPDEYLSNYRKHKFIEYLVKQKLFNLVNDLISNTWSNCINEKGKRIHDVLKVSREQVKILTTMNASMEELKVLQKANNEGVKLSKEQIRWISSLGRNTIIEYIKYSTAHKTIRYLKEKAISSKLSQSVTCGDYIDYLNSCEKLGYDLHNKFVLFPKNLKEAHDIATREWQSRKDRIRKMGADDRNEQMEQIAEELVKKYAMKDKKFSIRIPWTCEEIKKEGQALHHCVGSYVDRVLTKETIILFIRQNKELDKPFFTLELNHDSIIQVRGRYNCGTDSEVQRFVDKFRTKKLQCIFNRRVG